MMTKSPKSKSRKPVRRKRSGVLVLVRVKGRQKSIPTRLAGMPSIGHQIEVHYLGKRYEPTVRAVKTARSGKQYGAVVKVDTLGKPTGRVLQQSSKKKSSKGTATSSRNLANNDGGFGLLLVLALVAIVVVVVVASAS